MSEESANQSPAGQLLRRLALLEQEVVAAVERRGPPEPGHAPKGEWTGQGLFITEADVARVLARRPLAPGRDTPTAMADLLSSAEEPSDDRLSELAPVFGLEILDLAILLVALAPDVDARFEDLFAYLADNVTRRRPTVALALELCGVSLASASARSRLRPEAPLRRYRLLTLEEPNLPFPSRALQVPDRVVDHLLGGDVPDELVAPLALPPLAVPSPHADAIERALKGHVGLFYLRSPGGAPNFAEAAGALVEMGLSVLTVDLARVGSEDDPKDVAVAVAREAGLLQAGLVAGPIDDLAQRHPGAIEALARSPGPTLLLGSRAWEPVWTSAVPLTLDVGSPQAGDAEEVWRALLDGDGELAGDLGGITSTFRLAPHQMLRAAQAARAHAHSHGGALDAEAVRAGARAQNGGGLETLARRVRPRASGDDLVLPEPATGQVQEIAMRARMRHRVVGEWRMHGLGSKGDGITALFAGPSGTGKTLAAEVIAGQLGLDLYVVDLSSVVDKYIGETEKNLERIFTGAQGLNGVLFFDEADALFGKRSAVSDGHDRYANIEVAFLLQRMEQFDGVSLLATNLTANMDDAFARRVDVRIIFPQPEAPERRRLWARHLPPTLPVADDVDLDFLAQSFRLAGGDIRNITVAAAYAAADRGEPVGMAHLIRATAREYRKLGRLCTEEEFGPYLELVEV